MNITRTPKKTIRLDALEVGAVFYYPDEEESVYMVIDKNDCFLDCTKFDKDMIICVDLVDGGIYTGCNHSEVIEVHGSFVIS